MVALSPEQVAAHLSPGGWSDADAVAEVNNAASEAALVEKVERCADVVRECGLAATHDDGGD
jgi:hypothetical protein